MMPAPPFKLLCVMAHYVLDRIGTDAPVSEIVAELKIDLARARLPSPPSAHFTAVADAVLLVRKKGYRTPTRTKQRQSKTRKSPDFCISDAE